MSQKMSKALSLGDQTPVVLIGDDGKKIEAITSMEVAEMMEVDHSNLLKKIDNITASLVKVNFDFYKCWKESTYINPSNNKTCRCFDVTKFGCEFLANKMTGDKGNIFTAKYIERFHTMEDYIKQELVKPLSAKEQLALQYQYLTEVDNRVDEVKAEVTDLKDNMPLFNVECKELQSLVRKKGTQVLGGYKSKAYNDNHLRGTVYSDIQKQLRREFGIDKYEAIKRSQFEIAKEIVNQYKAPMVLIQDIDLLNSQATLFDDKG